MNKPFEIDLVHFPDENEGSLTFDFRTMKCYQRATGAARSTRIAATRDIWRSAIDVKLILESRFRR